MVKKISSCSNLYNRDLDQTPYLIGITGRSGSGKSTLVNNIQKYFGEDVVAIHSMDNYYLESDQQIVDENGYKNFDLPQSFHHAKFSNDLTELKAGRSITFSRYDFKLEGGAEDMILESAPIIIIEGLFIFHYPEVMSSLDYKVLVELSFETAFKRRLLRDQSDRWYDPEITRYRYYNHVEPAYQQYILPYKDRMDLVVENSVSLETGEKIIKGLVNKIIHKERL